MGRRCASEIDTKGEVREPSIERLQIGQVETPVQGRNRRGTQEAKQRKLHDVYVKVQHVKLIVALPQVVEHQHMMWQRVGHRLVEPQRHWAATNQPGSRLGIPAGKQRHLVPSAHELLGYVRDDALGTTVQPRRNALRQRRNLCDPHFSENLLMLHCKCKTPVCRDSSRASEKCL